MVVEHKTNRRKTKIISDFIDPFEDADGITLSLFRGLTLLLPLCQALPQVLIFFLPCPLCWEVSWSQRTLISQGPDTPATQELHGQVARETRWELVGL